MKLFELFLREDEEPVKADAEKKKPEADEDGITDVIPQEDETPEEEPEDETPSDEDETPPEETSSEEDDVPSDQTDVDDEDAEDVGSVAEQEGFQKSSDNIFAFGKTRKVTTLTRDEMLGGLDLTLQYIINPETGAWSFRACLAGQSAEDMVEFSTGEDPTSLIKHLKRKKKITAHQAAEYLHPPANKGDDGDDE